jgi:hypothetical protein
MRKPPSNDRLELVAALLAAVLGAGAVLFVLLGPLYATQGGSASSDGTVTSVSGSASLLEAGLDPLTATIFAMAVLAAVGIGLGGVLHVRRGWTAGRALLAISTAALFGVAVLGILSIGVFLMPSTLLGVVALAAGTPPLPSAPWPHP